MLKLKALFHWLDEEIANKSLSYISDSLSFKLEEFKTTLRKHGIKTALATVAGTFGAISIPAAINQLQAQPLWASLLEGIFIGGAATAKVMHDYIDTKPTPPKEIAWVYEVNKKTS